MRYYSQEVLSISDSLLNWLGSECESDVVFNHDDDITLDRIRVLRAQNHIRLEEFDLAKIELLEIDTLLCDLENESTALCLHRISKYGFDCTDSLACNYNPNSVVDNGSCVPPTYECSDGTKKCNESECGGE